MLRRTAVTMLVLASLIAGCGGGGGDDATPTSPAETPAATPAASPGPSSEIRGLDLLTLDPVQALLETTGGIYVQGSVLYADLTGDGAEDAVVPVSSGGTLGDIAFIVLALGDGGTETLITVEPDGGGGISVSIEDGQVVTLEPAPGPDDPECCPGQFFRKVYVWDGSSLRLDSVGAVDASEIGEATPVPTP